MRRIRRSHRVDARRNRVCKSTSKWASRRRSVPARAAPAATEELRALGSNPHGARPPKMSASYGGARAASRHGTTPASRHGDRRADGSLPKGGVHGTHSTSASRPGQVPRRAAERAVAAAVTQERARASTGADRQPTTVRLQISLSTCEYEGRPTIRGGYVFVHCVSWMAIGSCTV
jgi:hypothetical protein